jgi:hypothetical protein
MTAQAQSTSTNAGGFIAMSKESPPTTTLVILPYRTEVRSSMALFNPFSYRSLTKELEVMIKTAAKVDIPAAMTPRVEESGYRTVEVG